MCLGSEAKLSHVLISALAPVVDRAGGGAEGVTPAAKVALKV